MILGRLSCKNDAENDSVFFPLPDFVPKFFRGNHLTVNTGAMPFDEKRKKGLGEGGGTW